VSENLFSNMTLKSKILLIVTVITIVGTAAVVSIRATEIRTQTNAFIEERLRDNATMTFAIFETVAQNTEILLDVAVGSAYRGLTDDSYDMAWSLANLLENINQESTRFYENIAVFDRNFNLAAIANPENDIPNILRFMVPYFDEKNSGGWISPAFQNPHSGRWQIMFTHPVFPYEGAVAFAAITINTEEMVHFLRGFTQGLSSFINIADREGRIFFSTRPEAYTGREVYDLGVIQAHGHVPHNELFRHLSALTDIYKLAYVTGDPNMSMDWTIVSFFDEHAVDNVWLAIFESLRVTVTGILLAAGTIIYIIHRALLPLAELAKSAGEVANGNLSVKFKVKQSDEISRLAHSFQGIVRAINIMRGNFKNAENAMTSGNAEFTLEDSRLGGVYDEMLASTNNIVKHMKQSLIKAENASKAKSDFLSKMSHEIRTPMNAIIGMTELILRDNISHSAREQAITIKQSGDHLLSIINDILDLSKVESGKLELAQAEYMFHSTVHDVISIIKMRMGNPDVRFAAYMQHNIPTFLFGDEVRVRQILLNVLTNALKYTRKGHFSLDITCEKIARDRVSLTMKIKDTGIGMKPDDLKLLFDEFAQFDLDKNRGIEGTGLGLTITKNLIEQMGGTIDVTSVYGEGSEFIIKLPQKFIKKDDAPPSFADKRVIVYGCTPLDATYISKALSDLKVNFEMSKNEDELNKLLAKGNWDFIFAEADMTYEVQRIVNDKSLNTKIVMLSDSYDAKFEVRSGQDFVLLIMPAYFISVVNVLNGNSGDFFAQEQNTEPFIAPDAKILIVDDIATNLKVAQGLLKLYGVDAVTVLSGKDAIASVKETDYDIVFMDHMMPEMDGVEATQNIRKLGGKFAHLPIVALTANAIVGAREMFLANGFNDFLSKPIEVSKLNSILAKWIPQEKQQQGTINQQEDDIAPEIRIPGVDVARGVSLSGGSFSTYIEVLGVYLKNGNEKMTQLENCVSQGDISLYTTYVHAMKSASANIGAGELSKEAATLEEAGTKNDFDFITANNAAFLQKLKTLLAGIKEVVDASVGTADVNIDDEQLAQLLAKLKSALETFDVVTIDDVSEQLRLYTSHPENGAALDEILQAAFVGQYQQAIEKILEF